MNCTTVAPLAGIEQDPSEASGRWLPDMTDSSMQTTATLPKSLDWPVSLAILPNHPHCRVCRKLPDTRSSQHTQSTASPDVGAGLPQSAQQFTAILLDVSHLFQPTRQQRIRRRVSDYLCGSSGSSGLERLVVSTSAIVGIRSQAICDPRSPQPSL
ncbi:unnamed protein product [Jaminaea pallidilutea]